MSGMDVREEVIGAGARAYLNFLAFIGSMKRAVQLAREAEAAGIEGAMRQLPKAAALIDPTDARLDDAIRDYVDRGIVSEADAARVFRGQI
jgi:hypothetical protein